jgi:hypothetical protein
MGPRSEDAGYTTLKAYIDVIKECPDETFHEMTGKKGDVILLHPLMLHSASKNGARQIRIITNPPVSNNEPFQFSRPGHPEEYSLVELKTMQAVGGDSAPEIFKDWKITAERELVVPERVKRQTKMLEEENRRLKELGLLKDGEEVSELADAGIRLRVTQQAQKAAMVH